MLIDHDNDFRDIRLFTTKIIFLETSHQESDAAVYDVWLAQAVKHDKTLLKFLKRNSSALDKIARNFDASHSTADIVCFYEDKDVSYELWQTQMCWLLLLHLTEFVSLWHTQLIDHQSVSLHGKRAIYLTIDHSKLNKFRDLEDENFLLMQLEIQRMIQTTSQRIKKRHYCTIHLLYTRTCILQSFFNFS